MAGFPPAIFLSRFNFDWSVTSYFQKPVKFIFGWRGSAARALEIERA
jgi:hypothetical protein